MRTQGLRLGAQASMRVSGKVKSFSQEQPTLTACSQASVTLPAERLCSAKQSR